MNKRILVVDDEENLVNIIANILEKEGYAVQKGYSAEEVVKVALKGSFSTMLVDLKMPGMGGMGFLKNLKENGVDSNIIIMTAYGTIETAVEAMRVGAFDYITKPVSTEELLINVEKSVKAYNLFHQNIQLKEELNSLYGEKKLIGVSEAIKGIYYLIDMVSTNDSANVLITGESGTGKELIAREIHTRSKRADMSFIPVNCSAIPETLLESELFGFEKGAFTGAITKRDGKFVRANGGTIFLDEIADMPLSMQVKLLRVIQDKEVTPIGGDDSISVDLRIISATNKDIETMVKSRKFRDDLFYRLNVVPIHILPLRERKEDIPVLVKFIVDRLNEKLKKNISYPDDDVILKLLKYEFPGNVRELENMLERAFILAGYNKLRLEHFPMLNYHKIESDVLQDKTLKELSNEARMIAEREAIQNALIKTNWNKFRAAKLLEVDYKTLRNKIKELNIFPSFKEERSK